MGCSGSKAAKANEIAIKPKEEKSESGMKPAEKTPAKAEVQPQTKQPVNEVKNIKSEVLKPQNAEPEEGFGIIRTVSSKPGNVEVKNQKPASVEEQVKNWLDSIYSSAKNHI